MPYEAASRSKVACVWALAIIDSAVLKFCLLYTSDNHDVTRVASILSNEKHLPLIYALSFGMPGIPCVYYGSEWGAKARKEEGDPALRACFDAPVENELTEWIDVYKRQ